MKALTQQLIHIAEAAGDAIMSIYQRDFDVDTKTDNSPLTEADLAAHRIIVKELADISNYPILSEESADIPWNTRKNWTTYWLVDPLDGTKEFIKKNGEFTVNIALIHHGDPILGVVYAPALGVVYAGDTTGAYKRFEGQTLSINTRKHNQGAPWKVVGSRSHQSPAITFLLDSLEGESQLVPMGSSLKICLVAEGEADLYPRLGPTCEWDTAAAHAVARAAGASITEFGPDMPLADSTKVLRYNQKESLLNPHFLVSPHAQ